MLISNSRSHSCFPHVKVLLIHVRNFLLSQLSVVQSDLIHRSTCVTISLTPISLTNDNVTISCWCVWYTFWCIGSYFSPILVNSDTHSNTMVYHHTMYPTSSGTTVHNIVSIWFINSVPVKTLYNLIGVKTTFTLSSIHWA